MKREDKTTVQQSASKLSVCPRNIRNYFTTFKMRNLRVNENTLSSSFSLSNTLLHNGLIKIKKQRLENVTTNIICHLHINSLRNKFDDLIETIKNFNIFLTSESKLDASFP